MRFITTLAAHGLTLASSAIAAPQGASACASLEPCPTLSAPPEPPRAPNVYTLTAFAPGNTEFNGLKVNNLALFVEKVGQYCPTPPVTVCPNGTDQVFVGTLTPSVMVPGGQDLYVTADGRLSITVQHSHSVPLDAYWNYQGWSWTGLSYPPTRANYAPPVMSGCPATDPLYNCTAPSGFYTFKAPDDNSTRGGVLACPYQQFEGAPPSKQYGLWARTPKFVEREDCVELTGLGTHEYSGIMPPVWAY